MYSSSVPKPTESKLGASSASKVACANALTTARTTESTKLGGVRDAVRIATTR